MQEEKGQTTCGSEADVVDSGVVVGIPGEEEDLRLSGGSIQKIDDKGRFTFPKKLREGIGDEQDAIVITRGARLKGYRHLWAMPKKEWEKLVGTINGMPESDNKMRVSMHFMGGRDECEIDKFGRVLLNSALRKYAGVESGELFITGIGRKIVIMDLAVYESYMGQGGYDELIEEDVDKLGL